MTGISTVDQLLGLPSVGDGAAYQQRYAQFANAGLIQRGGRYQPCNGGLEFDYARLCEKAAKVFDENAAKLDAP